MARNDDTTTTRRVSRVENGGNMPRKSNTRTRKAATTSPANTILTKACTKCGKRMHVTSDNFYRDKSQKDGHAPWCKVCERDYNRAYRAGLKGAEASRKRDIANDEGVKVFEDEMTPERVVRGANKSERKIVKQRKSRAKAKS